VVFKNTRDIDELGRMLGTLSQSVAVATRECEGLTPRAVAYRYFEAPREPEEADALDGLAKAQRLYDEVLAALAL